MTEEAEKPDAGGRISLPPPLDAFRRQFEALDEEGRTLAEGLDASRFNWSPGPGAWSIGQCFDHLNEVTSMYLDRLEEAIPAARARGLTGETGRYGWLERWFAREMEPPIKRRLRAPRKMQPVPQLDPETTLARFLGLKARAVDLIERCDGLDMARVKVRNPLFHVVKLSAGAAVSIIAAHERRHLWQARRVRSAEGFPSTS